MHKSNCKFYSLLLAVLLIASFFLITNISGSTLRPFSTIITSVSGESSTVISIASNSNSSMDGNWIEFKNGEPIQIPKLLLTYNNPRNNTYFDGARVTIQSFSPVNKVVYPYPTYPVYLLSEKPSVIFRGSPEFAGLEVDFKLLLLNPKTLASIINKATTGNITSLVWNLNRAKTAAHTNLDSNGDASAEFYLDQAGSWTLLVVAKSSTVNSINYWILGGTTIEVFEYPMYVGVQPKIGVGSSFNVDLYTKSPAQLKYIYGTVLVDKGAYNFNVNFNSSFGLIPESDSSINGLAFSSDIEKIIKGSFETSGSGQTYDKNFLIKTITQIFGSNARSIGFSEPLSTGHGVLSLTTDKTLPLGEYLLISGVWEMETGNHVTSVRQTMITFVQSSPSPSPSPSSTPTPSPKPSPTPSNGSKNGGSSNWIFVIIDVVLVIILAVVVVLSRRH